MNKFREAIIVIALSQVGVKESGGNNKGEAIRKYLDSTWMDDDAKQKGFPWCAAFITWVTKEARRKCRLTWRDINLYIGAAAYGWEDWAKQEGWKLKNENEKALPGDLVTYDFSHIGIVIEDHGDTIITVEGNTNNKGERDSDTGDGVWKKERARSLVKTFIELPDIG